MTEIMCAPADHGRIPALIAAHLSRIGERVRGGIYRAIWGVPDLALSELPSLLDSQAKGLQIQKKEHTDFRNGALYVFEVKNGDVSIIYRLKVKQPHIVEMVDILFPGRSGLVLTFVGGKISLIDRLGGRLTKDPVLTSEDQKAVEEFMARLMCVF